MNTYRRSVLIGILTVLLSIPFLTAGNVRAEDPYEDNDTLETAWPFDPGYNWVRTWLSDINGFGIQADDDWYRIDVDLASERIYVDCQFKDAEGDIDIELYDSNGLLLAWSYSPNDNEFIDYPISSGGTYYIRVWYGNAGNTYDLRWDDFTEDVYEENDTRGTAWHPGYNWERKSLSSIDGFGIQADDDWYRIDVDAASHGIQVYCQFTHAEGDIDIGLYDSTGTLLASSETSTDNESVDHAISGGGTYYIKVYKGNGGNTYDLSWDDLSEDAYEENDDWGKAWHPEFNWERTWLSDINGLGIQNDDDWYRIDVDAASQRIQVDCRFTHADGDIDIGLYYYDPDNPPDPSWAPPDPSWAPLASSESVYDNELIDVPISVSGTYYIRVHFSNVGNAYDLRWDDFSTVYTALISDFASLGLYQYDRAVWSKLTVSDPEYLAVYNGKLVGDFGSAGLWEFDGSSWSKLTPSDADNTGNCMVAYGTGLVIDFGALGLYWYDGGAWNFLTTADVQYLTTYGSKLVGDFGVHGLWEFEGASWSQLTSSDADNSGNCMVAYGTGLVIDFGGLGLYQYDSGAWSKLTVSDPEYLAIYNGKLVGDFGGNGLWEFDGASWSQLTPSDADNTGNCMVAHGTGLVIDFGAFGLYRYDGGGWNWLTPADVQYLTAYGSKLAGDFGSSGLWELDGSSWSQLTSSDADNSGNCMVAVDFQ